MRTRTAVLLGTSFALLVMLVAAMGIIGLFTVNWLLADTPEDLQRAVAFKDFPKIERLLKDHPGWGKEVLDGRRGTALNIAFEDRNEALVWLLMKYPFDPNYPAPSSGSPLSFAAAWGKEEIVRALLKAGADINRAGPSHSHHPTPLQRAVRGGQLEMVKFLIDHGADMNGIDPTGYFPPPVVQAILAPADRDWSEKREILKYLLEQGAKIPTADTPGMDEKRILEWAKIMDTPPDMVELLKKYGAVE